ASETDVQDLARMIEKTLGSKKTYFHLLSRRFCDRFRRSTWRQWIHVSQKRPRLSIILFQRLFIRRGINKRVSTASASIHSVASSVEHKFPRFKDQCSIARVTEGTRTDVHWSGPRDMRCPVRNPRKR